tara:strand:- start:208 stop:1047 length:840 start_codon:yes stop_codon:yes gene_type:complete
MKKYAIVEIKGGLGNQIFQYSFSNYLKKMGFSIKYNLDFYQTDDTNNTQREFLLDTLNVELEPANLFYIKFINFLNFLVNSRKINKILPFLKKHIFKYFKEKDFKSDDLFDHYPVFNYFDGYWQNNENLIIIQKNELFSKFRLSKTSFQNKKTMIHVRRSDYLQLGIELPLEYYVEAFKLLENKIGKFNFDIYTDDYGWVMKQEIFSSCQNIYTEKDDTVTTFKNMIGYQHYIIANSTYSYLAALFGEEKLSQIMMPYKWSKNKDENFLTENNWTKVKF